jgi:copper chaperone CopZ
MKHDLSIQGMHCDRCVSRVKALLGKVPGLTVGEVTIGHASIDADTDAQAEACEVLARAGYQVEAR